MIMMSLRRLLLLLIIFTPGLLRANPVRRCSKPQFKIAEPVDVFPSDGVAKYTEIRLRCKEKYYDQVVRSSCYQPGGHHEWTAPEPDCQLVNCSKPVSLTNGNYQLEQSGKVTYSQRPSPGVNDKVNYTCNEGYSYTGSHIRICQRNGTWSGKSGICEAIKCDNLPGLNNGFYSKPSHFSSGDIVRVACDKGYVYSGSEELKCSMHGKWTGKTGRCTKLTDIECILPEIPHIQLPINNVTYGYNVKVKMACKRGYNYTGSVTRTCQATNAWAGSLGQCKKFICPDVKDELEHGNIYKSDKINYEYGDQLNLHCDEGYILNGSIPVCGEDGKWNNTIESCVYDVDSKISIGVAVGILVGAIVLCALFIALITYCRVKRGKKYQPVDPGKARWTKGDKTGDENIDLDTQYIKLKLIEGDPRDDKSVEIWKLIDEEEIGKMYLLYGKAGVGKSTLVQWLMRQRVKGEFAKDFKHAVLFRIRDLMQYVGPLSLNEFLMKFDLYKTKGSIGRDDGSQTLMFLDGLDEWPGLLQKWNESEAEGNTEEKNSFTWVIDILKRKVLTKSTLVMTSRPFKGMKNLKPNFKIEVVGLTPDTIDDFIKKNVKEEMRNDVQSQLDGQPILKSMSVVTFFCLRLCRYLEKGGRLLDDELLSYTKIIVFIIGTYTYREDGIKQRKRTSYKSLYKKLARLASIGNNENKTSTSANSPLVFDAQQMKSSGMGDTDVEASVNLGLLYCTNGDGDQRLEFVHLSIQEFFSMVYLVQQNTDNVQKSLTKLWSAEGSSMALQYLFGLMSGDEELLSTVFDDDALTKIQRHKELLFAFLHGQKEEELSRHDKLRAIQCVYESQSPSDAKKLGEVLFRKKGEVKIRDLNLTAVDIKGIVCTLTELDFPFCMKLNRLTIDEACQKMIGEFLDQTEQVKEVSLEGTTLSEKGLEEIMNAIGSSQKLTACSLKSTHLKDEQMKYVIGAVCENKELDKLSLENNSFTGDGFKSLADSLMSRDRPLKLRLDKDGGKIVNIMAELTKENEKIKMDWVQDQN